jgi:hypothetical protein
METLIKSTTEAMKEMMVLVKSENKPSENKPLPNNNDMLIGGRKKRNEERHKMYSNAPICKHCNRKHPAKKEEECGMRSKCSIPSIVLEIIQEHLKVCGASRRNRDMATRQSVVE